VVVLGLALGAVLAAGCGQMSWPWGGDAGQSPMGRLAKTNETAAPAMPAPEGAGRDDVNPVSGMVKPEKPATTPAAKTPPPSTSPLSRPDKESKYQAKLDGVPPSPTPLLAPRAEGDDQVFLVNTVLAQVNDEVITREDILGGLRPQIDQWRKEMSKPAFENHYRYIVEQKLREAINQRLAVQEAKRTLSEDEKKQIDAQLDKTLKLMISEAGSKPLLEERLSKQGTTLDTAIQKEKDRVLVQRFLHEKVAPTVHVTHSELQRRYDEVCQERYVKQTRVHLLLMTLKKSEFESLEQGKSAAVDVQRRVVEGEPFGKLAERNSHDVMATKGGDWGFITQGAFKVKAVDDAVFQLGTGEVAPLIETRDAWYVAKVAAREDGRTVPLTEVQEDIEDEIREKHYNEAVNKYIQDLYKRAYVRIIAENL
jgi:parvulin-like peptidyl-prolyl isomerase